MCFERIGWFSLVHVKKKSLLACNGKSECRPRHRKTEMKLGKQRLCLSPLAGHTERTGRFRICLHNFRTHRSLSRRQIAKSLTRLNNKSFNPFRSIRSIWGTPFGRTANPSDPRRHRQTNKDLHETHHPSIVGTADKMNAINVASVPNAAVPGTNGIKIDVEAAQRLRGMHKFRHS